MGVRISNIPYHLFNISIIPWKLSPLYPRISQKISLIQFILSRIIPYTRIIPYFLEISHIPNTLTGSHYLSFKSCETIIIAIWSWEIIEFANAKLFGYKTLAERSTILGQTFEIFFTSDVWPFGLVKKHCSTSRIRSAMSYKTSKHRLYHTKNVWKAMFLWCDQTVKHYVWQANLKFLPKHCLIVGQGAYSRTNRPSPSTITS